MLDFWNDLSRSVREEILNADSVREANTALQERLAAIYVRSPKGGRPRLDFVLREREPGAPLVSARLVAVDPDNPDHEGLVEGWLFAPAQKQTDPLTLVNRSGCHLFLPPVVTDSGPTGCRL